MPLLSLCSDLMYGIRAGLLIVGDDGCRKKVPEKFSN